MALSKKHGAIVKSFINKERCGSHKTKEFRRRDH